MVDDFKQDFFGKTNLTVSGQLEATYAQGLGNVYTFGPTFRAKIQTPHDTWLIWMIEPEMAFYELEDNMDLAENYQVHT